jgi:hypothetical protein
MTPDRRQFLKSAAAAAAATSFPLFATAKDTPAGPTAKSAAETAVKALYDSLTDKQKKDVCFAWDHQEKDRGLLRTFVSNNWQITKHTLNSEFFTKEQRGIVGDIFKGLVNPDWHKRFVQQLVEDNGGKEFGTAQSIAIFGEPGGEKFEFVMTGRHQTIRADGNTEKHVAFGGPIFYGHAGKNFNEDKGHPGNVFWPQAVAANKVYTMLDEKQRKAALAKDSPKESAVQFRGEKVTEQPGLLISELTGDVRKEIQKVLEALIEPFRTEDRDECVAVLKAQGGLDKCKLTFFADEDIGFDDVWDNWRIEGPSFVWYFRGCPHVHVWVNVADDAGVKLNARG